ncbi:hypothetical protein [Schlesneria sp. DSM 10557]|uniref:hypothetical protein n=1 Tax=Schlesneria sp. DSM 10557 TaxID=3044399 RepID=UPI0035A0CBFD
MPSRSAQNGGPSQQFPSERGPSMNDNSRYSHQQRAPLCILLYGSACLLFILGLVLRHDPVISWTFPLTGAFVLLLAGSFHYLRVEDEGDELLIRFGPIPLFQTRLKYADIESAEVGRTLVLDGWGIHLSPRGGWVWNLWGRDCVVFRKSDGEVLRVGTDQPHELATFVNSRLHA